MISLVFTAGKFEFGSGVAMPNGKIFGNKTTIKMFLNWNIANVEEVKEFMASAI